MPLQLLNLLVHNLLGYHHHSHDAKTNTQEISGSDGENDQVDEGPEISPPCCSSDPAAQIDQMQHMADEMERKEDDDNVVVATDGVPSPPGGDGEEKDEEGEEEANFKVSKTESKKLSRMI